MKSIRLLTIVLFITLGLSGCSTIIDKTYKPEQLGDDQKALLAKPVELDQVLVERIKNDGSRKIEDVITDQYPDYRVLGSSGFRITSVSDQEIKRNSTRIHQGTYALKHQNGRR